MQKKKKKPQNKAPFMKAKKNSPIFRAYELSPISGLYVKVIADYEEDGEKHHQDDSGTQ